MTSEVMKILVSFSIIPPVSRVLSTIAMAFRPGQPWRFRSQSTS